jgi:rhodanese-related sulfurtransferase
MTSPDAMEITPQELADRIRRGDPLFLLDVRHDWEHQLARLPDHAVIPLHELPARLEELRADGPIVCYCHHGVRSLSAAGILRQAGHENAVSLAGGIDLWSRLIDPSVPRY